MILRILGEGQFDVAEGRIPELNELDTALTKALDNDDDKSFRAGLASLLEKVREVGTPLAADDLRPSDYILPAADAHVDDVRELLTNEGLIPDLIPE